MATQRKWAMPLIVFEGPKEPGCVMHALRPTVDYFKAANPGDPAHTPHSLFDASLQQEVPHTPVLAYVIADAPAMAMLRMASGHTAKAACQLCAHRGSTDGAGGSTVRWLGYNSAWLGYVPCVPPAADEGQYPPGLLAPNNTTPRTAWLPQKQQMQPTTWTSDNVLKYSECEMVARVRKGDCIRQEAERQFPLGELTGELKRAMYEAQQKHMQDPHRKLGCRGSNGFEALSYYRPQFFFALAVAHLTLGGILKDWFAKWFAPPGANRDTQGHEYRLPTACRTKMAGRRHELLGTDSFKKKCPDVTSRSDWMFEDYLAFLETYSPLVFHNLPWAAEHAHVKKVFEEQWGHLRAACLYFLRYREGQHTSERMDAAAAHALAYGASVEKVYGYAALTTFKLHQFVCHLRDQAMSHGAVANCLEMWVERQCQYAKRMVKYRMTAHPELLFINDHCLLQAMARRRRHHADECKSFDELIPANRRKQPCAANRDLARDHLGLQLLGAAAKRWDVPALVRQGLDRELLGDADWYLRNAGWDAISGTDSPAPAHRAKLSKYVRAILPSEDTMSSTAGNTQRTKDSSWALIGFIEEAGPKYYIAHMKHFVLAEYSIDPLRNCVPDQAQPPIPLKLAVCDLFKCQILKGAGLETEIDIGLEDDADGAASAAAPSARSKLVKVPDLMMAQVGGAGAKVWDDWVTNLASFATQLVPCKEFEVGGKLYRYLLCANKASGRTFSS